MHAHLVIMAKAPVAGQVKTRLVPTLGEQGAADLAQAMLLRTVTTALASVGEHLVSVTLCASPAPGHPDWQGVSLPSALQWVDQGSGDLGQRMARAVQTRLQNSERVILIGTDCPELTPTLLQAAVAALDTHDVSLLPTTDGGYALLGLRSWQAVFEDMPWSTDAVCALTLARLAHASVWLGPHVHDIDEPGDLVHWPDQAGLLALRAGTSHAV